MFHKKAGIELPHKTDTSLRKEIAQPRGRRAELFLALFLLFLIPACASADTLNLWSENAQPGQQFGLELCQFHCSTALLAELGPFTDTGGPQTFFFAASNPETAMLLQYITSPNPDSFTFVETIAAQNLYFGHSDAYPAGGAVIDGLLIQSTGDMVTYSVTGSGLLVSEPSTLWLLAVGLFVMGSLRLRVAFRRNTSV